MLQSVGSQRVGHNLATEQQQQSNQGQPLRLQQTPIGFWKPSPHGIQSLTIYRRHFLEQSSVTLLPHQTTKSFSAKSRPEDWVPLIRPCQLHAMPPWQASRLLGSLGEVLQGPSPSAGCISLPGTPSSSCCHVRGGLGALSLFPARIPRASPLRPSVCWCRVVHLWAGLSLAEGSRKTKPGSAHHPHSS